MTASAHPGRPSDTWSTPRALLMSDELRALAVAAAREFAVHPDKVIYGDKTKSAVRARSAALYVARFRWRMSYPELGEAFGINHTTAIAAVRRAARLAEHAPWFREITARLEEGTR